MSIRLTSFSLCTVTPLLSLPFLSHSPHISLCLCLPHINPVLINLPLSLLVAPHCISHISKSCYFLLPCSFFFSLFYPLLAAACRLNAIFMMYPLGLFFSFHALSSVSLLLYLMYMDPGLLAHIESPNT